MKRFQFNLQSVLGWRERQELAAREAHGRALAFEREVQGRLAAHDSESEAFRAYRLERMRGACAALEMVRCQEHGTHLESRRLVCQRELREASRQTQASLARMLEARQKRELMDKLRERLRLRHDLEAGRAAQRELDDMVSARHALRTGSLHAPAPA